MPTTRQPRKPPAPAALLASAAASLGVWLAPIPAAGEAAGGVGLTAGVGVLAGTREGPRDAAEGFFPSWFAWWETRRDGFLADRWPGGSPPAAEPGWLAARDEAAAALADRLDRLRAAAGEADPREEEALLLALGRVGGLAAAERLDPAAAGSSAARGATLLALGLLGGEAAAERLRVGLASGSPAEVAGAAAGFTLLPTLRDADAEALVGVVRRGPTDDARRWALRALDAHRPPAASALMPAVVREVPRVFLVERALLAAPAFERREDRGLLLDLLTAGGGTDRYAVGGEVATLGPLLWPSAGATPRPRGAGPTGALDAEPLFFNPLEQLIESAAAFGLARLSPSEDGFGEDAAEELLERLRDPGVAGSEPSRASAALALACLLTDEQPDAAALLRDLADGDGPRPPLRVLPPRLRVAGGGEPPEPAELEDRAVRSFSLLGSALTARRLSPRAGAAPLSVFPLRIAPHDALELREDTRRVLVGNAGDTRQPRGVRFAAAVGLGLTADRASLGEGDRASPLTLDPEALAAGDPLVAAGLIASMEALAALPAPGEAAQRRSDEARGRTNRFLDAAAAAAGGGSLAGVRLAAARHAVQGLAHRPSDAAAPDARTLEALAAADPALALEVAAAARWRRDVSLGPWFAARLGTRGGDGVAAAHALGAMFDARSPSGLDRLARTTHPVVLLRADAPRGLFLARRVDAHRLGLRVGFPGVAWWEDPPGASLLDGWPQRAELRLVNPYLAEGWDERWLAD